MTARPHHLCTYPNCDCLLRGAQCLPARREEEDRAAEARKALEPYCSACGLPERDLDMCEDESCLHGFAEMVQPEAHG